MLGYLGRDAIGFRHKGPSAGVAARRPHLQQRTDCVRRIRAGFVGVVLARMTAICQAISALVEITQTRSRARSSGVGPVNVVTGPVEVADGVTVAGQNEMRDVQAEERGSFGAQERPVRVGRLVPIGQARDEIRLRRPRRAVVHAAMGLQPLQQHRIEARRPHDLADRRAGKAIEQMSLIRSPRPLRQKPGIVLKARDEGVDMIAESRVAAVDMRQIRVRLVDQFCSGRPHARRY